MIRTDIFVRSPIEIMKTIPLLLTATVNPQGMQGAQFAPDDRAAMYVEAIRFYDTILPEGSPIIVAENSGCATLLKEKVGESRCRIEFLELKDAAEYDQTRGKGYNETLLLTAALRHSRLMTEETAIGFFKLTGRLKVLNIVALLQECLRRDEKCRKQAVEDGQGLQFLADCKDHNVYEWLRMPINGHAGECRYFFASKDFFERMMAPRYCEMYDYDDGKRPMRLAEDLMLDVCRKSRGMKGCHDRFSTQARISGRGGHNLGKGSSFFYSTDNDSFALRVKCGLRQCLRWLMPWWRA